MGYALPLLDCANRDNVAAPASIVILDDRKTHSLTNRQADQCQSLWKARHPLRYQTILAL